VPRRGLSMAVLSALAAATLTLAPTSATAQYYNGHHGRGAWHDHGGGYERGGFDGYDGRGDPRDGGRDRRGYPRGYDRHRCRNGAGGTILGAIAGGLLGNAVSGRGDRTAGTIIGGGAGALAGSAIGRDC
jgi:Glycine zipper 2TM domain